jgi:hypothetical protein
MCDDDFSGLLSAVCSPHAGAIDCKQFLCGKLKEVSVKLVCPALLSRRDNFHGGGVFYKQEFEHGTVLFGQIKRIWRLHMHFLSSLRGQRKHIIPILRAVCIV